MPATPPKPAIHFLSDLSLYRTEKPYRIYGIPLPEGAPVSNMEFELHADLQIENVRGAREKDSAAMATHSFCWIDRPSMVKGSESHGTEEGMKRYIDETLELVQELFEPERVVCYDYRVSLNSSRRRLFFSLFGGLHAWSERYYNCTACCMADTRTTISYGTMSR
jgi:hypothetical protein